MKPHHATLLLIATLAAAPVGAATLLVYNNSDANIAGSLRHAINDNALLGGGNTILISNIVTGTNTLGSELLITNNVTIVGPGANVLTVSGNNSTRVFDIGAVTVTISNLTIAYGRASSGGGGGIRNSGNLTLSGCAIQFNVAHSTLFQNLSGGGIYNSATLTVNNSTFATNSADWFGGAIYTTGGSLTVNVSTFAGNSGPLSGGAISTVSPAAAISDCTISGNSGGGGGGINNNGGTITVRNSIVAGNTASGSGPDCYGSFSSAGFNLIGAADGSTGFGTFGDQVGTTNNSINPMLGPLQYNCGPTPTMALLPGSPAIDQGKASGFSTDQRGRPRTYDVSSITNSPFGDGTDIGAYEVAPISLVVSNNNDSGPGSLRQALADAGGTDGDTISFAPAVTDTILLTSGELAMAKTLTISGPGQKVLAVNGNSAGRVFHVLYGGNVTLLGLTITNGVVANDQAGGILNEGMLALRECAVVGNRAGAVGGGIGNLGTLSITNCTVANNTVYGVGSGSAVGGGIYTCGELTVWNSTFSHNQTSASTNWTAGGGIANNFDAYVEVYNSTFYGNGGLFCDGGAVYVDILRGGATTLTSCTISGNSGGIYYGGWDRFTVRNSIIAGNTASGGVGPDCYGRFISTGFNLISTSDGSTGFTNGVNNDKVGTIASPLDPLLGPLQDNGGVTPTMALLSGSPAIDAGNASGLSTDQRGLPRPVDLSGYPNVSDGSDIGAYEVQLAVGPRLWVMRTTTNTVCVGWPVSSSSWQLQGTKDLAATGSSWAAYSYTTNGANCIYIASPPTGRKFYRLKQP